MTDEDCLCDAGLKDKRIVGEDDYKTMIPILSLLSILGVISLPTTAELNEMDEMLDKHIEKLRHGLLKQSDTETGARLD